MILFEPNTRLIFLGSFVETEDPEFDFYSVWVDQAKHADMKYLENYRHVRKHPLEINNKAKQFSFFALPYEGKTKSTKSQIASYALGKDYHKVFKEKLQTVYDNFFQEGKVSANLIQITVDTAPILERSLSIHSSKELFRGKNTLSIHRELGSYFMIGAWVLDDLWTPATEYFEEISIASKPKKDACGSCKRCQVHCPTGALEEDYRLDAKKCLSYWTIEHRGLIPKEYWKFLKEYWYGCDICQNVCPFNRIISKDKMAHKKIFPKNDSEFKENLLNLDLKCVAEMSQIFYEKNFGGSALTRAKRSGLRRNALIAMYVSKDSRIKETALFCAEDTDPTVKETALEILLELKNSKALKPMTSL